MQKNDLNAVEITDSAKKDGNLLSEDKLSNRNLFMYAFGTLGRDFLYNLFNGYLLSFCVFTKSLNTAQFSAITIIIVLARIFDAGGTLEGTFKQVAGNRKQNYYDQDQGRSPAC